MAFQTLRMVSFSSLAALSIMGCVAPSESASAVSVQRTAVVKGTPAAIADFPATVAMIDTQNGEAVFCTGSLLGPRHVLSAAHCLANLVSTPSRVNVVVGHADVSQAPDSAVFDVATIAVHPQWTGFPSNGDADGLDVTNDVAVLTLGTDVPNPQVAYVLPDARIESDLPLRAALEIVGFGNDDNRKRGILRRGVVPLRKRTAQLLLAGELGSADSCEYDSGGPLYLIAKDGLYLVGITSREWPGAVQLSCGEGGVYTLPMAYRAFIEAQLGAALPTGVGPLPGADGGTLPMRDAGVTTPDDASDAGEEPASVGDAGDDDTDSPGPNPTDDGRGGSAGGCTVSHAAGMDLVWCLLALPLLVRRRRRSFKR